MYIPYCVHNSHVVPRIIRYSVVSMYRCFNSYSYFRVIKSLLVLRSLRCCNVTTWSNSPVGTSRTCSGMTPRWRLSVHVPIVTFNQRNSDRLRYKRFPNYCAEKDRRAVVNSDVIFWLNKSF